MIRTADSPVQMDTGLILPIRNLQLGIVKLMERGTVNIKFAKVQCILLGLIVNIIEKIMNCFIKFT